MIPIQIMVVEDEIIVAMDIENNLKGLGYSVPAVVCSGEEAIQKAAETHPDLVLMDIVLTGDIDGVEAAQHIGDRFNIPIVYLTSYADKKTLNRAKKTNPFGYIIKPFTEKELEATIIIALERKKRVRKLENGEQWFGTIFGTILNSLTNAVVVTDKTGSITYMNPAAEEMSGWKQEESFGKNWIETFNIINKETGKVVNDLVTKTLEPGIRLNIENHVILSKDGRAIPIDETTLPLADDRGNITGAVLIFQDITKCVKKDLALD